IPEASTVNIENLQLRVGELLAKTNPEFLIIFDNANNINDIKNYIPSSVNKGYGYVLVSTQESNFFTSNMGHNLSINHGLTLDEGLQVFKNYNPTALTSNKRTDTDNEIKKLIAFLKRR